MNLFNSARSILGSVTGKARLNTAEVFLTGLFNRWSTYPSNGLTPVRLAELLRAADSGDVFSQMELFEEMLEKDTHLFGCVQRRKLSVLKWDHQIMPATDDPMHKKHAEYATKVLNNCENWRGALEDILDADAKGWAVLQKFWFINPADKSVGLQKLEWAHQKNFRWGKGSDPQSDMRELRRVTDTNRYDGVPLEEGRWLVAIMKARSGHPARASLLRTVTWMYLFKNFDVKSWIRFAEAYGLPLRVGKYSQTTSDKDKKVLLEALRNIAQDASALIPDTTKLEFVEAAQKAATASIHSDLANFCNTEMSKAILGHTGSIDSTAGKLGSEDAAMEATHDIVQAVASALDYIISDQLIKPLLIYAFGELDQYAYYKTLVQPPKDVKLNAEVLNIAINQLGLSIAEHAVYDLLNLPKPAEGETIIVPRPQIQPQQPTDPMAFSSPLRRILAGRTLG